MNKIYLALILAMMMAVVGVSAYNYYEGYTLNTSAVEFHDEFDRTASDVGNGWIESDGGVIQDTSSFSTNGQELDWTDGAQTGAKVAYFGFSSPFFNEVFTVEFDLQVNYGDPFQFRIGNTYKEDIQADVPYAGQYLWAMETPVDWHNNLWTTSGAASLDTNFHHYKIVIDMTTNTTTFYLDGGLVGSAGLQTDSWNPHGQQEGVNVIDFHTYAGGSGEALVDNLVVYGGSESPYYIPLPPLPEGCYQETATEATQCGGLNTGSYECLGDYNVSHPCTNSYDGDWNTFAATPGTQSQIFIDYAKPIGSIGATWRVKYQIGNTVNVTDFPLPAGCFGNENNDHIELTIIYGGFGYYIQCNTPPDGNDGWWENPIWYMPEGNFEPKTLFEEAIIWDMPEPIYPTEPAFLNPHGGGVYYNTYSETFSWGASTTDQTGVSYECRWGGDSATFEFPLTCGTYDPASTVVYGFQYSTDGENWQDAPEQYQNYGGCPECSSWNPEWPLETYFLRPSDFPEGTVYLRIRAYDGNAYSDWVESDPTTICYSQWNCTEWNMDDCQYYGDGTYYTCVAGQDLSTCGGTGYGLFPDDYGYVAQESFRNKLSCSQCEPNWYCSESTGDCDATVDQCLAVSDSNECGVEFAGNLEDFNGRCQVHVPYDKTHPWWDTHWTTRNAITFDSIMGEDGSITFFANAHRFDCANEDMSDLRLVSLDGEVEYVGIMWGDWQQNGGYSAFPTDEAVAAYIENVPYDHSGLWGYMYCNNPSATWEPDLNISSSDFGDKVHQQTLDFSWFVEDYVPESSSSHTRYLVDASGNVVGVQYGNQVVTTPQQKAPFLSLMGGQSFDLVGWLKGLWAQLITLFGGN